MLQTFPDSIAYDRKLQDTDLAYLFSSEKALGSLAGNYVGLSFRVLGALVVKSQQVISCWIESVHRHQAANATVWPVPVVVVLPACQG